MIAEKSESAMSPVGEQRVQRRACAPIGVGASTLCAAFWARRRSLAIMAAVKPARYSRFAGELRHQLRAPGNSRSAPSTGRTTGCSPRTAWRPAAPGARRGRTPRTRRASRSPAACCCRSWPPGRSRRAGVHHRLAHQLQDRAGARHAGLAAADHEGERRVLRPATPPETGASSTSSPCSAAA